MRNIVRICFRRSVPLILCALLAIGGVSAQSPSPQTGPNPTAPEISDYDGVRFLEQSTFGATRQHLSRVQRQGIKAFLDDQFSIPMSVYPDLPVFDSDSSIGCPDGSDPNCFRDNYTMYPLQIRFFQNALYGDDQLRQRVAWALHSIFVVSGVSIQQPSQLSPYINIFSREAFGNFRQILMDVTLNPAMGAYLNMVNNNKTSGGNSPNENYAREVLQLFSIGLYKLNQDGTLQLDGLGQPIPTYTQTQILGFAKVFTGWTYAPKPGIPSVWTNPENFLAPMVYIQSHHDTASKTLLNGVVCPSGQNAKKDLVFALDNIFKHPNVGPFICKQLIQQLVTANPSPAYVSRVAGVFNNNGAGVRGDLRAVVLAILMDSEARCDDVATCVPATDVNYGHLRSPILYVTNILRAYNAISDEVSLSDFTRNMGEEPMYSPTVFSYYRPNFVIPGTNTLLGPEFTIQSSAAAISRANFANTVVFGRIGTAPAGTAIDLTGLQALSTGDGTGVALVDDLNKLLMHGTMSAAMRTKILQTITALPGVTANDHLKRARWALYLVLTSSQYQVAR